MSELRDLYQEVILDHNKRPRNFRRLEDGHKADGFNPLCGDRVTVFLKVEEGLVKDVSFQGSGCAISTASASMMTESIKGRTLEEVEALFHKFHGMVTSGGGEVPDGLGKLEVFAGVSEYPSRVKCASLAWHTLQAALQEAPAPVSTE